MSLAIRLAGVGLGSGNPIPAINLRFTEGVVDPRITFTRSTTATYVNSAGLIASAAIDTPRIDYDPVTLAAKGLLIEEARTNLLTYSQEFDNAAWTKSSTTVTANATTAPDGTATAEKLVEVAATTTHRIVQGTAKAASAITYTASLWMKAGERTIGQVIMTDIGGFVVVSFDLAAGTVGTPAVSVWTSASATIAAYAGGWYRCTLTATSTADTVVNMFGALATGLVDAPTTNYLGDITKGLYIWGAQLEAGSVSASYVPTTTATVTRALSSPLVTGGNFSGFYNQAAFTAVVKFKGQASGTRTYLSFSDGTANERIELQSVGGTLTLTVVDGGVAQAALALGSVVTGTDYTVAMAWAANDFSASVNGAANVTDTSGTLPTPDRLAIGMDYASANHQCTTTARVTGYPSRLPDATLRSLAA